MHWLSETPKGLMSITNLVNEPLRDHGTCLFILESLGEARPSYEWKEWPNPIKDPTPHVNLAPAGNIVETICHDFFSDQLQSHPMTRLHHWRALGTGVARSGGNKKFGGPREQPGKTQVPCFGLVPRIHGWGTERHLGGTKPST